MGLAATQARFLSLTAKKTNIEFEGQQINQQRTTLANQSASYFNSMMTLTVPTPPSTDSFKTISYSFKTPEGYTANISQFTGKDDAATILYTYGETTSQIAQATNTYKVTSSNSKYFYNQKEINALSSDSEFYADVTNGIKELTGKTELSNIYYLNAGSEATPSYIYFLKDDLDTAVSSNKNSVGYKFADVTSYKTKTATGVQLTRDSQNRLQSITMNGTNYAVTSTVVTDQEAYNDAYNEYTYQTYLYNQKLEEINAQTSIVQAEDKKLELRLKQLDTEESAINTEIDSLSSVIDKNIENSFKTFA